MTFSLGEIRAMALKAARGAGYPWGLAEEAGQATTWLCAHALPGCEALAALLARNLAAELSAHSPRGPEWDATRDLCPLITGAALCDNATRLTRGPLLLPPVAEPLLLLPFLALVSADTGQPLAMVTDGFHARTDGDALETEGKLPRHACNIVLRRDDPPGPPPALRSRAAPDPTAWERLARFAHRTYAPASDASRLLGAGAGLSDND